MVIIGVVAPRDGTVLTALLDHVVKDVIFQSPPLSTSKQIAE